MLVLSRKLNEVIQIGDSITITVLRMKGNAVRLGIQAPVELSVLRGELAEKLQAQHTVVEVDVPARTAEPVARQRRQHNSPQQTACPEMTWPAERCESTCRLQAGTVLPTGHSHARNWST
jgi:carbon storage regulator CsrA